MLMLHRERIEGEVGAHHKKYDFMPFYANFVIFVFIRVRFNVADAHGKNRNSPARSQAQESRLLSPHLQGEHRS